MVEIVCREQLDNVARYVAEIDTEDFDFRISANCHPTVGLQVYYDTRSGTLILRCAECNEAIEMRIVVADDPEGLHK